MAQIQVIFKSDLRTEAEHIRSGNKIITDAPPDNNGKGEAFSPSDLVCSALASCMLTIMGIVAERESLNIDGMKADVVKIMTSNPRKIQEIQVNIFKPSGPEFSDKHKEILKRAALTCPVALSLNPDINQVVNFDW